MCQSLRQLMPKLFDASLMKNKRHILYLCVIGCLEFEFNEDGS
jgi:hypothetical protein